ncbi:MAG: tetratricopeptide repeat protein, partial [Planctomycetota bacterium]|nr:tetratricopeptide repeat protein [Planctomycetota bacterium]
LVAIVEKEPAAPRSLNARVPADVETICLKALQKDPAQRYAHIGEMAGDVALYLEGEQIKARPAGKLGTLLRRARRNARTVVPTCVAGLLIIAFVAWLMVSSIIRTEKVKDRLAEAAEFERNEHLLEARDSYLAVLELDADNETATTGFTRVKGRLEAIESARESGWLAAEVEKRRAEDNLARLSVHMKLVDEGRAPLDKAILFLYRKDSSYAELLEMLETSKLKFEEAIEKTPGFAPAYFMLGRTWYLMGWTGKSDECYRLAIERDPNYRQACYQLGRLLLERAFVKTLGVKSEQRSANRAAAESLLTEATAFLDKADARPEAGGGPRGEDPTEMDRALADAMLVYAKGDARRAAELCSAAIAKFPKKLGVEDFYWLRGASLYGAQCVADFDKAIELRPKFPLALFCRAIARRSLGNLEGAIADYTEAIEFCPRFIEAYTNRGSVKHLLGKNESAGADFDKALEIDPEYAEAYCARSAVRNTIGDLDGAFEDANRAFELEPALTEAIVNRGNARMYKRDFEGAVADFTKAIEIDPMFAKAFFNRATAIYYSGDLQGAIADYSRAIEVDAGFPEAYVNRANMRFELGELDKAFADYSEAIRLKPGFATALANRGNVRYEKGDKAGALADYEAAIEADPLYATPRLNRGHARHEAGDFDGAVADFSEAIRLNPQQADAYYFRGVSRHGKGDLKGAVADLSEFIGRAPDDPDGYLARGKALADSGDMKGAVEDIEKALRVAPRDWTLRGEAEERIKRLRNE